jgi:hypothetical protein
MIDFLDDPAEEPVVDAAPTPEPEEVQETVERPRDESGRFAPKEPAMVPVTALQQERERRQAIERQLEQERTRPEVPDLYQDPEAFAAYQQSQTQSIALNVKLDLSEDMAREKHGDQAVDEARDWALAKFASNPAFQQEVMSQRNPYGYVVSQHKREQMFSSVTSDDLAEFQAWKAAKANPLQPTPPPPIAPPRSIASAPAAGTSKPGQEPLYAGAAFDAVFRKA